ncbi:MAG: hypothetical protein FWC47_17475 [Oscillospiraceae bacterium]|nr:hypothetical protein [Oscillospiraceae bacterium]
MSVKKTYLEKSKQKIGYVEYEMKDGNLYVLSTFLEERYRNIFIIKDICRKVNAILEDENPEYIIAAIDDKENFLKVLKNMVKNIEIYEEDGRDYMKIDSYQVKQKLKSFI